MTNYNLNFTPIFLLLLFFLFVFQTSAQQDGVCKNVDCGKGSCVASTNSITGYECDCISGWNRTLPVPFSACGIPNCTLNFQCGNGAPSPPTPPFILPPLNLTDPCSLVWCGDGTCIGNETSHSYYCQCFDGSANLLNLTTFVCVKQCFFGADCGELNLGSNQPPPSTPPSKSNGMLAPPPPNGSNNVSKSSKNYLVLNLILLLAFNLLSI